MNFNKKDAYNELQQDLTAPSFRRHGRPRDLVTVGFAKTICSCGGDPHRDLLSFQPHSRATPSR